MNARERVKSIGPHCMFVCTAPCCIAMQYCIHASEGARAPIFPMRTAFLYTNDIDCSDKSKEQIRQ